MKKILILSANPINTDRLRLDEEVREVQLALERSKRREQFEVISRWAIRIDDLRRALLDHEPQIVHFSGHGIPANNIALENSGQLQQQREAYRLSSPKVGIALENNSGQLQLVSTESIKNLFELFKGKIECVLLNACYSETQAEAIYQHIDCVIGMNHSIQDRAAINFSKGFYDAITAGRNYEEAFKFGCNNIDLNSIHQSLIPVIKIRKNSTNSFASEQINPNQKKQEPDMTSNSQSLNISGGNLSGVQLGQAARDLTQNQQNTQDGTEKELTLNEVVERIAQIETLFRTSDLPEDLKEKAINLLKSAKDEVKEKEPDKDFATKNLQKATKVLKEANETFGAGQGLWQKLQPIAEQLAPWLGIAAKNLLLLP
ncbi:CHAT domain-containing protein [Scytonema hofmannii FACHB-248]|uniref:CHAT domain-containing protein n=1 Tax=Scytonema hofmannii FACHB-248 TaxID=1842502 RepID=A0ABR8H0G0_9CYAN|nr:MULTISPECIES: CHAT domain-containing protein [Nostocales]MBD2608736.1 CHAT domain-containing protein [Scytonema hofmannii FACHB-248]